MMNITKANDLIHLINSPHDLAPISEETASTTGGMVLNVKVTMIKLSTSYLLSRQWLISELETYDHIEELINNDEAFDIVKDFTEYGFALICNRLHFVMREDLD